MTREEKFSAIVERLKSVDLEFDPMHISSMVIIGYLETLAEKGLIESVFKVTGIGKNVCAICEEFDWQPTDDEIKAFVMEMVEGPDRPGFMFLIKKYRDDREGMLKEFEDFKKSDENNGFSEA